ncbi:MAG: hypothetical protein AVDCRST_MAG93-5656 [uncultured Chloroflexia bacterium]|uniref:DNA-binding phage zinc finger domain-containing protein n=1 Tax=uncultured Chloroflexia bacterium TaxID=1672391 RepID=A0A6J4L0E0_9CHLR|nr:MAG: hypothetical protein AVDCRST_MAG93-5656 [uncultured Chloroflexia bacterium]
MTALSITCFTCNAKPGKLCTVPRGHSAPRGGVHAARRADALDDTGPINAVPKQHYIKRGQYAHGCGEPVKLDHVAQFWVRGRIMSWRMGDPEICPRCNRKLWIEDLGPPALPRTQRSPIDSASEVEQTSMTFS